MKQVLHKVMMESEVDFLMAMGDDASDEHMYKACYSHFSEMESDRSIQNFFTITVGKKPSHANLYLEDASEVEELLSYLCEET